MKNWIALAISFLCLQCFAQQVFIKTPDYKTFRKEERVITPLLEQRSSDSAKKHPEYGILPPDAPCHECIELIDERTIDSRLFVDSKNPKRIYAEKSYFPLHYKNSATDVWHTIDYRLKPDAASPGVYAARNQPSPTGYDTNKNLSSITVAGHKLEFNKNLSVYFFDDSVAYTEPQNANYSYSTIGQQGLKVKNIWKGIDMSQVYRAGQIETNYLIPAPLQLPLQSGWMVVEDHFTMPDGLHIEEAPDGRRDDKGFYSGDYILKDSAGNDIFILERPVYLEARDFGMQGAYRLSQKGKECTLQTMVPLSFLNNKNNQYPICIDPRVNGAQAQLGQFHSSGRAGENMKFTTKNVGSCPFSLPMTMPTGFKPFQATIGLEYFLTNTPFCGTPSLNVGSFCPFSAITQTIINNDCNTTFGPVTCNQIAGFISDSASANPTFCTTDSNLIPGAHNIFIENFSPGFMACEQASCAPVKMMFTLQNQEQDSTCTESCGYSCANGTMWFMFVEGEGFDINFPANQVTAVAGQSISLTAATTAGVAPYTYQWTIDGNTTTNSDSTFSLTVTKTDTLFVEAIDACGDSSQAQIIINVVYPPTADPGSDTTICNGGQVIVGGSDDHTPPPGDTIFWTAQDSSEQGWISNDSIYHPTITIPRGVTGSFTFKFTVIDSTGILEDSVTITSVPNPPLFVTGDSIITCANASIILTASSGFNYYVWSTGSRDTAITVNQPGQYNVTATEGSCSDTSNQVNVTQLTAQGVQVFPDTTIKYGDSVMLTAQPSLDGSGIDSFRWYGQNGLTCDTCFTPFVSPLNSQIYGVRVYSQGCEVTDSVYINVILPINFFIPNVFSPNGDGSDDYFFIMAQPGVTVQSFQVYDRIGEKVHDGQYPWDGNFKGKPEPPGTYVYIFKLSVYGGNAPIEQHGTITLLR